MPIGRGIYLDEPRDQARSQFADKKHSNSTAQDDKRDVAPDEQSLEHAQEPPD